MFTDLLHYDDMAETGACPRSERRIHFYAITCPSYGRKVENQVGRWT